MNYFRKLRKDKKLSQTDLSRIMQVSVTTISRVERGFLLTDHLIYLYSKIFNLSISELYENTRKNIFEEFDKNYKFKQAYKCNHCGIILRIECVIKEENEFVEYILCGNCQSGSLELITIVGDNKLCVEI